MVLYHFAIFLNFVSLKKCTLAAALNIIAANNAVEATPCMLLSPLTSVLQIAVGIKHKYPPTVQASEQHANLLLKQPHRDLGQHPHFISSFFANSLIPL
jgi:hypothetical protein